MLGQEISQDEGNGVEQHKRWVLEEASQNINIVKHKQNCTRKFHFEGSGNKINSYNTEVIAIYAIQIPHWNYNNFICHSCLIVKHAFCGYYTYLHLSLTHTHTTFCVYEIVCTFHVFYIQIQICCIHMYVLYIIRAIPRSAKCYPDLIYISLYRYTQEGSILPHKCIKLFMLVTPIMLN